jgi:hypothetical protein
MKLYTHVADQQSRAATDRILPGEDRH